MAAAGMHIHDKFVVVDFNGANPTVFTGSSNLAAGGEEQNGDSLAMIEDGSIATMYAIEAVAMFDHYHFNKAANAATTAKPLTLWSPGKSNTPWWKEVLRQDQDPDAGSLLVRQHTAAGRDGCDQDGGLVGRGWQRASRRRKEDCGASEEAAGRGAGSQTCRGPQEGGARQEGAGKAEVDGEKAARERLISPLRGFPAAASSHVGRARRRIEFRRWCRTASASERRFCRR